ncbi:glycosyltransferase family 2 protein [Xanthomonas hyacinthi]|uniref:Glycosyltransferase n=2 Tax=Xanthomonas hyacinthi TaxID=56455 RepID=A0A2S7F421_9XANT|nr:ribonuclease III [Xanthomonas hyacinthi DSM 19077]PPV00105.1 glycosyltransferase [Xanthomonas hyacinthi]QGY76157.1 glycosyltransferase family 2 protein [Xanthomonas hyacinthi]
MSADTCVLSVVIPVYRSESILPTLAEKLGQTLPAMFGDSFEVILVNDCSPDRSREVLLELARARSWWKVVNLRKNAGQHNAIMAGLRVARGRQIVTMDDDLQHNPEDIPQLLAALAEGYDVCYASFHAKQHALWKKAGSAFNDRMAVYLLGKAPGLYLSPFRAMVSGIRDELIKFTGPNVYLDGLILANTASITSIKIDHHARADGQSGYSLRKSVSLWLKMATSFSVFPLRLASLTGIAVSMLGFLLALLFIIQRFIFNAMPVGWASLMVCTLIVGGIQLLALGVIGEYLGRALRHVNATPQVVIESTANIPSPGESTTP